MRFIMLLFAGTALAADDPRLGGPTTYATPSPNGQYLFVMIAPRSDAVDPETTSYAKEIYNKYHTTGSGLYQGADKLWGVDWYSYRVWPADDGVQLVRLHGDFPLSERFPASRRLPDETVAEQVNGPALSFYEKDRLLKMYTVRELVKNVDGLPHSLQHVLWSADGVMTRDGAKFGMMTQEPRQIYFDLSTGKVVSDAPAGLANAAFWAVRAGMAVVLAALLVLASAWLYRSLRK